MERIAKWIKNNRRSLWGILILAGVLGVAYAVICFKVKLDADNNTKMPSTIQIGIRFVLQFADMSVLKALGVTLRTLGISLFFAVVFGLVFGFLFGSKKKWAYTEPTVDFLRSIPVTFLIPILAIIFGSSDTINIYLLTIYPTSLIIMLGILSLPYFREKQKTRVAILLPLAGSPAEKDDADAQLAGIFDYIGSSKGQSHRNEIEYIFIDHRNESDIAKEAINEELAKGTQYFFSTMSRVNNELANYFINEINKDKKAILVCAVTSYPDIITQQGVVYRYYVRSQEEGNALAINNIINQVDTATAIVVGDDYGTGTLNSFKDKWKGARGTYNENAEIILPSKANEETIMASVEEKVKLLSNLKSATSFKRRTNKALLINKLNNALPNEKFHLPL